MDRAWIVAANSQRARLFAAEDAHGPIREFADLIDPLARQQRQDLKSDEAGRRRAGPGPGRQGMEPEYDVKDQERDRFAKRIAQRLREGRTQDRFARLYVLGDPTLVGSLRKAMDDNTRDVVAGEVSKNLVDHSPEDIRAHLPKQL